MLKNYLEPQGKEQQSFSWRDDGGEDHTGTSSQIPIMKKEIIFENPEAQIPQLKQSLYETCVTAKAKSIRNTINQVFSSNPMEFGFFRGIFLPPPIQVQLNTVKFIQINNMSQEQSKNVFSSFNFPLPYDPSPQNVYSLNVSIYQLYNMNQDLMHENALLKSQVARAHEEKMAIMAQNADLKKKANSSREVTKRKYTQRRSWLQKKYKCNHELCGNSYSSKIALNLHIRKRHNQIKVEE